MSPRKYISILFSTVLLILVCALSSHAVEKEQILRAFSTLQTGGSVVYGYAGQATGPGDPVISNGADYGVAGTRIYTEVWVADEPGTVDAVTIYIPGSWAAADSAFGCVYRNGTFIGRTVDLRSSSSWSWTGYHTISVESGQNLAFAVDDYIKIGYCGYNGIYHPLRRDIDATDGSNISYSSDSWGDAQSPPAVPGWISSSSKGLCIGLRYLK